MSRFRSSIKADNLKRCRSGATFGAGDLRVRLQLLLRLLFRLCVRFKKPDVRGVRFVEVC